MDSKMIKNQEQSEQLQDKELEALMGRRLDDLVKNFSLRNTFTRWVSVAVCIAGISVGMTMPVQAEENHVYPEIKRTTCEGDGDADDLVFVQEGDEPKEDGGDGIDGNGERKCFEGEGEIGGLLIGGVSKLYARENQGHVKTNKGTFQFFENDQINFNTGAGGTVVITGISLD